MSTSTSSPSLTTFAAAALTACCAMLAGCDHRLAADSADSRSAAMPMSVLAAMGPVYFGDTMSFGESDANEPVVLVAANKP